jgi:cytochrome c-type biogenesis protein CcmH/NrfG
MSYHCTVAQESGSLARPERRRLKPAIGRFGRVRFLQSLKESIMKKFFLTLLGAASFATALPAFAGPDWQIIEHGRKVKAERMRQEQAQRAQEEQQKNVQLPGNQADREQMMKACMEMMNKSKLQSDH